MSGSVMATSPPASPSPSATSPSSSSNMMSPPSASAIPFFPTSPFASPARPQQRDPAISDPAPDTPTSPSVKDISSQSPPNSSPIPFDLTAGSSTIPTHHSPVVANSSSRIKTESPTSSSSSSSSSTLVLQSTSVSVSASAVSSLRTSDQTASPLPTSQTLPPPSSSPSSSNNAGSSTPTSTSPAPSSSPLSPTSWQRANKPNKKDLKPIPLKSSAEPLVASSAAASTSPSSSSTPSIPLTALLSSISTPSTLLPLASSSNVSTSSLSTEIKSISSQFDSTMTPTTSGSPSQPDTRILNPFTSINSSNSTDLQSPISSSPSASSPLSSSPSSYSSTRRRSRSTVVGHTSLRPRTVERDPAATSSASSNSTGSPSSASSSPSQTGETAAPSTTPAWVRCEEAGIKAVIVLTHFCELHGPSILLCTQMLRSPPSFEGMDDSSDGQSPLGGRSSNTPVGSLPNMGIHRPTHPSYSSRPIPREPAIPTSLSQQFGSLSASLTRTSTGHRRSHSQPYIPFTPPIGGSFSFTSQSASPVLNLPTGSPASGPMGTTTYRGTTSCRSCNILSNESGFFSVSDEPNPDGMGTFFITTRYPPHMYSLIRTACVRSLSCEFCPGREGAMLFGDEENGYALSYVFKMRDINARGFVRWYSLLFILPHLSIVASWEPIVLNFRKIIDQLQHKSDEVFHREKAERAAASKTNAPMGSASASYLRTARAPNFPSGPAGLRRRQASFTQSLRGIPELLGIKELTCQLHTSFSWILQAWERHVAEPLDPSLQDLLPSFKLRVSPAHGVRTLEEYLKAAAAVTQSSSTSDENPTKAELSASSTSSSSTSSTSSSTSSSTGTNGIYNSQPIILSRKRTALLVNSGAIKTRDDPDKNGTREYLFQTHQQLLHAIGKNKMQQLIYNVICGNQIIVRGEDRSLNSSLLDLVKQLVPPPCVKAIEFSEDYRPAWECNMLCGPLAMTIPEDVDQFTIATLDVLPPAVPLDISSALGSTPAWTSYRYSFNAKAYEATTLGNAMMSILLRQLPEGIEGDRLKIKKDEWMSMAQAFYTLWRLVDHPADERVKRFMQLMEIAEPDLLVLRFWTTGLRHSPYLAGLLQERRRKSKPQAPTAASLATWKALGAPMGRGGASGSRSNATPALSSSSSGNGSGSGGGGGGGEGGGRSRLMTFALGLRSSESSDAIRARATTALGP